MAQEAGYKVIITDSEGNEFRSNLIHLPSASTSNSGVIKIATDDDITEGTDNTKAITPSQLNALKISLDNETTTRESEDNALQTNIDEKQDILIAGTGIVLSNNIISTSVDTEEIKECVKYISQDLTASQQLQARENINANSIDSISVIKAYLITTKLVGCEGDSSNYYYIGTNETSTLTFISTNGIALSEIAVINATYNWSLSDDSLTGTLILSNPTGDVTVSVGAWENPSLTENVLIITQTYEATQSDNTLNIG